MRLRNIPGSREIIAASEFVIPEGTLKDRPGHWHEVFGNDHPLYLEIGMGKGRFICEMARCFPASNFLGIEKYSSVLLRALDKREVMKEEGCADNLYFLRMDAEEIADVFGSCEVDGIYLNFSDPWPKDRHAHRRLPGRAFLARYEKILKPGGTVCFKTDNDALFSFAREEAEAAGWPILSLTMDLHRDEALMRENVMTEYEERFSAIGNPIHRILIQTPTV